MNLRLSDEQAELLRRQAELEHRSMAEVVRLAILDRVERYQRVAEVRAFARETLARHGHILARLAEE